MNAHDHDYFRRRAVAEGIVERDGLMPDFLTGAARLAMFEQLVGEHMPPAADRPYAHQARGREPSPTDAQVAAAIGRPAPVSDPVARATSMQQAIDDDMAAADRVRRGEPGDAE